MKPYKNKINRIRSFALSLIFIGVVIMYIGIFFRKNEIVMLIFMFLGVLAIIAVRLFMLGLDHYPHEPLKSSVLIVANIQKCLDASTCADIAENHLHWILH